jgi:hypothetical protein
MIDHIKPNHNVISDNINQMITLSVITSSLSLFQLFLLPKIHDETG